MTFDFIRSKFQTIFVVILIFLSVSLILTFIQPLKFETTSKMLIIQNFSQETDPYAASRSNQYLSSVLSEVVSSNSFYQEVLNSGYEIDKSYFKQTGFLASDELKAWQKTASAKPIGDTGVIEVSAYHTNRGQAEQISKAINFVMKTKNQNYHGSGDRVTIKVIDDPNTSNYPVKPNIALNAVLAVAFGSVFSLAFIYLFPGQDYNVKLIPGRKKYTYQAAWQNQQYYQENQNYYARPENKADQKGYNEQPKTYYIHHMPKQYLETANNQPGNAQGEYETVMQKPNRYYDEINDARQKADSEHTRIFEELARARAREAEMGIGQQKIRGDIKNILG